MKKDNQILKEVLERINPSKEELNSIDKFLKDFVLNLEKKLHANKANAQVFIGGSFAKNTMIKVTRAYIPTSVRLILGRSLRKLLKREIKVLNI